MQRVIALFSATIGVFFVYGVSFFWSNRPVTDLEKLKLLRQADGEQFVSFDPLSYSSTVSLFLFASSLLFGFFAIVRFRQEQYRHARLVSSSNPANGYRHAYGDLNEVFENSAIDQYARLVQFTPSRTINRLMHQARSEFCPSERFVMLLELSLRNDCKCGVIVFRVNSAATMTADTPFMDSTFLPKNVTFLQSSGSNLVFAVSHFKTKKELASVGVLLHATLNKILSIANGGSTHSIGLAMYPIDGYSMSELVDCAIFDAKPVIPNPPSLGPSISQWNARQDVEHLDLVA